MDLARVRKSNFSLRHFQIQGLFRHMPRDTSVTHFFYQRASSNNWDDVRYYLRRFVSRIESSGGLADANWNQLEPTITRTMIDSRDGLDNISLLEIFFLPIKITWKLFHYIWQKQLPYQGNVFRSFSKKC